MNSKTAVVIGGGRSLGAYLCKHLAKNGYDVAVADLNGDNAISVADEINAEAAAPEAIPATPQMKRQLLTPSARSAVIWTIFIFWFTSRASQKAARSPISSCLTLIFAST